MKKLHIILALAGLVIVGALFTVLASNMFFADIINMAAGFANSTLFVSLPAIAISCTCALGVFFFLRTYKNQGCFKRISKLYLIIALALNGVGFLGCILSGIVVYGTFVGSQPFPGYLIIFMILNLLLIAGGVLGLIFLKKLPEDENRVKINALYVLKTIGWFLFIMLIFNRLGTLLGAPSYWYLRNLYKTFPFYVSLLVPLALGVLQALKILGILEDKKLLFSVCAVAGFELVIWVYVAIVGMNDTAFVSSLSQAMPLERMAAKPLEMLIQLLAYAGVIAALVVQAVKKLKAE